MTDREPSSALCFDQTDRNAIYNAIRSRRDVRRQFTGEPIPDSVLTRILEAAHLAPSVGFMQPWNFIVVRDHSVRDRVKRLAEEERHAFAGTLPPERAERFRGIKIEGILESSLNICVTCDPSRGGPHVLGRHTLPETDLYSTCLAIGNLWLAARAEGIGVGWVSFYRKDGLRRILGVPDGIEPLAYLCVGPVTHFPPIPDLEAFGWEQRRRLATLVFDDRWGRPSELFCGGGEMIEAQVRSLASRVTEPDARAEAAARARQDQLTKPRGSLGRLEDLGVRLAAIAGVCPPPVPERPAVVIAAGDHGVLSRGVSPWPKEVTAAMVHGFCADRAAVNALAKVIEAQVTVLDVGVASDLPRHPRLRHAKVRPGTGDLSEGPAMTRQEAARAVLAGAGIAEELVSSGVDLLVTGDMGIGNTTPAACLIAAFTGRRPEEVTGRGTGIDDDGWTRKRDVVAAALARTAGRTEPVELLTALGSADLAATVGFLVEASTLGVPVVLDGLMSVACAVVAEAMAPGAAAWWVAGHRSTEPAQAHALKSLGLEPLLDVGMRLGEGSGAVAALPMLRSGIAVLRDVALLAEILPS